PLLTSPLGLTFALQRRLPFREKNIGLAAHAPEWDNPTNPCKRISQIIAQRSILRLKRVVLYLQSDHALMLGLEAVEGDVESEVAVRGHVLFPFVVAKKIRSALCGCLLRTSSCPPPPPWAVPKRRRAVGPFFALRDAAINCCPGVIVRTKRAIQPLMLTNQQLEEAFKVYFDEIDACIKVKTYWALLHTILCLPDICAALETVNGEATGPGYLDWADHLADPALNGVDWYEMRCKLLHQGRTIAKKSKYTKFLFGQPAADGTKDHQRTVGSEIHLDVGELAREMVDGIRNWFNRLLAQPTSVATSNVEKNL